MIQLCAVEQEFNVGVVGLMLEDKVPVTIETIAAILTASLELR